MAKFKTIIIVGAAIVAVGLISQVFRGNQRAKECAEFQGLEKKKCEEDGVDRLRRIKAQSDPDQYDCWLNNTCDALRIRQCAEFTEREYNELCRRHGVKYTREIKSQVDEDNKRPPSTRDPHQFERDKARAELDAMQIEASRKQLQLLCQRNRVQFPNESFPVCTKWGF